MRCQKIFSYKISTSCKQTNEKQNKQKQKKHKPYEYDEFMQIIDMKIFLAYLLNKLLHVEVQQNFTTHKQLNKYENYIRTHKHQHVTTTIYKTAVEIHQQKKALSVFYMLYVFLINL